MPNNNEYPQPLDSDDGLHYYRADDTKEYPVPKEQLETIEEQFLKILDEQLSIYSSASHKWQLELLTGPDIVNPTRQFINFLNKNLPEFEARNAIDILLVRLIYFTFIVADAKHNQLLISPQTTKDIEYVLNRNSNNESESESYSHIHKAQIRYVGEVLFAITNTYPSWQLSEKINKLITQIYSKNEESITKKLLLTRNVIKELLTYPQSENDIDPTALAEQNPSEMVRLPHNTNGSEAYLLAKVCPNFNWRTHSSPSNDLSTALTEDPMQFWPFKVSTDNEFGGSNLDIEWYWDDQIDDTTELPALVNLKNFLQYYSYEGEEVLISARKLVDNPEFQQIFKDFYNHLDKFDETVLNQPANALTLYAAQLIFLTSLVESSNFWSVATALTPYRSPKHKTVQKAHHKLCSFILDCLNYAQYAFLPETMIKEIEYNSQTPGEIRELIISITTKILDKRNGKLSLEESTDLDFIFNFNINKGSNSMAVIELAATYYEEIAGANIPPIKQLISERPSLVFPFNYIKLT